VCRDFFIGGKACERRQRRRKQAGFGAAVEKIEQADSAKIFSGTARGNPLLDVGFLRLRSKNLLSPP